MIQGKFDILLSKQGNVNVSEYYIWKFSHDKYRVLDTKWHKVYLLSVRSAVVIN